MNLPYIYMLVLSFFCVHRDNALFDHDLCHCTIGQVAEAFHPYGYLCTSTATLGSYVCGRKFAHSSKLVTPYFISVSELFHL